SSTRVTRWQKSAPLVKRERRAARRRSPQRLAPEVVGRPTISAGGRRPKRAAPAFGRGSQTPRNDAVLSGWRRRSSAARPSALEAEGQSAQGEGRRPQASAAENQEDWCPGRDLNPDELPHTPLKRTRIPIPPPGHQVRCRFAPWISKGQGVGTEEGT